MTGDGIPFGQKEYFNQKHVLFIVPHPDDEINVAGGLIHWLFSMGNKVTVVYTTNGNYRGKGAARVEEAYNSIIQLGGKKEDIIFLGYSDQQAKGASHLYMSETGWKDRYGKRETYVCGSNEFCFQRYGVHHEQNHNNFINDLKEVLLLVHSDIIFCVDFDSHPDHRAASLGFEHAMGEIMREGSYRPKVFKTFAYPLTYKGKKDFYNEYLKSTKYNPEALADSRFQNPYYKWNERVRFALLPEARELLLPKNVIYKALKKHKSQNISERADRIINNDQVAWLRRTDSLLYDGVKIKCSSGEKGYLNDFLLYDCSNIMNGSLFKPIFDKGIWKPDELDIEPVIKIEFSEKRIINKIVLYRNAIETCGINKVAICFNGRISNVYENISKDLIWTIEIEDIFIENIEIKVLNRDSINGGLTEIEVFYDVKRKEGWEHPIHNEDFWYGKEMDAFHQNGNYIFDGNKGEKVIYETIISKSIASRKLLFLYDRVLLFGDRVFHSVRRRIQKIMNRY